MNKLFKNKGLLIIGGIILVAVLLSQQKKESISIKSSLSNCLVDRIETINRYIGDSSSFVSPCYIINSQVDSCSSYIDSGDIGDYLLVDSRSGRASLDSDDEEALSCAEQYSTPVTEDICNTYSYYCNGNNINWKCDGVEKGITTSCPIGSTCSGSTSGKEPRTGNWLQTNLCSVNNCPEGQVTSTCVCGGLTKSDGYCCSGFWQSESCSGSCTDSDGQNFENKGYVIDVNYNNGEKIYDSCSSPTPSQVYEVICLNNQYDVIVKDCRTINSNYICQDGACKTPSVPSEYCIDTDGGDNIYIKGWITKSGGVELTPTQITQYTDSCQITTGNLVEYNCNTVMPYTAYAQTYICTSGCENGACKPSTCTDKDGDGYGTSGSTGCSKIGIDCNDNAGSINPGVQEICNSGIDENCNNQIDEANCLNKCGDGDCQTIWETCNNCPSDCGNCPQPPPTPDGGTADDCNNQCMGFIQTCKQTTGGKYTGTDGKQYACKTNSFIWMIGIGLLVLVAVKSISKPK